MNFLKHKKTIWEFGQVLLTFLVIVFVVFIGIAAQKQQYDEVVVWCDSQYGEGNWIFNTSYQGINQIHTCINVSLPKLNLTCECDC